VYVGNFLVSVVFTYFYLRFSGMIRGLVESNVCPEKGKEEKKGNGN